RPPAEHVFRAIPGHSSRPIPARRARLHWKLCNSCRICRALLAFWIDFCRSGPRIVPLMQKKEGRMAKGSGRGGKGLKFDAAGPGLTKAEILKVCERENVRFMRLQFTDILGIIKNV